MGFDIGFHSFRIEDIEAAYGYVFDNSNELPYLNRGITASRSRFIANSYGLGVSKFRSSISNKAWEVVEKEAEAQKPGFFGKLLGKKTPEPEPPNIDYSQFVGDFDSDLHIWGRPFLIGDRHNSEAIIKAYMASDADAAIELAKKQLDHIFPELSVKITPDKAERPGEDDLKHTITWKLDILRNAVKSYPSAVKDEDGNEHSSDDLLRYQLSYYVLESVSFSHPTWMDRGYVWPTALFDNIGVEPDYFKPFSQLNPFKDLMPGDVIERSENQITENYMLGGMVMPSDIERFSNDVQTHKSTIIDYAKKEGWDFQCAQVVEKLEDCLAYALSNEHGFVESADIYSGFAGVIT